MEKNNDFVNGLLDILVMRKLVLPQEAAALSKGFADSASEQFEYFLLAEGLIEKEDLLLALGQYYKAPPIDVKGIFFDHVLVMDFPKDFLLRNAVIPYEIDGDMLNVIAAEPDIPGLEHAIRAYSSYDIDFMVGLRLDICDAVKEYYDESLTEEIPSDEDIKLEHNLQMQEQEIEERDGNISQWDE